MALRILSFGSRWKVWSASRSGFFIYHFHVQTFKDPEAFILNGLYYFIRSGLYGGCSNGVPPIHFFQAEHRIQFRSRIMRFLGFSNHEKGAPREEISK
jgi:hypothetical protein